MIEIVVHNHALKHGLTKEEVKYAWLHFARQRHRKTPYSDQLVAVGTTPTGLIVEVVAIEKADEILIYHALTPPTKSILRELGLRRRK